MHALTIQDEQGNIVGNKNGELALEIPGSFLDIPLGVIPDLDIDYPERYIIPDATVVTTTLIYSTSGQAGLFAILPGGIAQVNSDISQGQITDTVFVAPDAHVLTLEAESDGKERSLSLLREGEEGGREVTINQFALTTDNYASLSIDPNTEVVSFTTSLAQSSYQIELAQVAYTSTLFIGQAPPIGSGDVHIISLDWNNPLTATVGIDVGGDGTVDQTIVLDNQAAKGVVFLPLVRSDALVENSVISETHRTPSPFTTLESMLLSISSSYTATTDANGYYTFTNLIAGNYSIQPSMAGADFYTFFPQRGLAA